MHRVGVVGYGYWGPNLARNFNSNPNCQLVRVADLRKERRDLAAATYPGVETTDRADDVTKADDLDIVAVATPVKDHFLPAKAALESGKHVWVEKPITSTSRQAKELVELAGSKERILMVDHTFLFTGAVKKIKELTVKEALGRLFYYDSVRINLGLFQSDINVIWDLACHDYYIMDHVLGASPKAVAAQGVVHFHPGVEDVAYVTLYYENDLLGHVHVSWLSPVKLRQTLIGGSKKMLVWDDISPDEKIKIYDKGVQMQPNEDQNQFLAEYRIGDMHAPTIPNIEALRLEVSYMVECIKEKRQPHNNGEAGERVIRLLEATDESLKNQGARIEL